MFLCTLLISAAFIQGSDPWQDPAKFLGQIWKVEGTVLVTRKTADICYLNFSRDWNTDLNAVIFARDFARFPRNPEVYYRGKVVEVSGPIGIYMGKPEIFVVEPAQIRVLEDPARSRPEATADASRPKAPPASTTATPAASVPAPRKTALYEAVGVSQNLVKVAGEGAMVILGDGSRWQVFQGDRKITMGWQSNEAVVVEKMTKPLDNYSYILVNMGRWQQAIAVYMGIK